MGSLLVGLSSGADPIAIMTSPSSGSIPTDELLRHAGFVRSVARQLLEDEGLAEDVTQETWIAALESPPHSRDALRAWLGRVAQRIALRKIRGHGRRRKREELSAQDEALPSVAEELGHASVLREVSEAVLALREPYRSTLFGRFYEGKSCADLAQEAGCPVATIESRLRRALLQLRERLDRSQGRELWCAHLIALVAPLPIAKRASDWARASGALTGTVIMSSQLKLVSLGVVALLGAFAGWSWLTRGEEPALRQAALETSERAGDLPTSPEPRDEPTASDRVASRPAEVQEGDAAWVAPQFAESTLTARLRLPNGEVAVGRRLEFSPWEGGDPVADMRRAYTDEAGEVFLDSAPEGLMFVFLDIGAGWRIDIPPNTDHEIELNIPPGLQVEGKVIDPGGLPVAGASLWLSSEGLDTEGSVIATSDAQGNFRLEHIPQDRSLAAWHEAWGPSTLRVIKGAVGDEVQLELRLSARSAQLRGRVQDIHGQAVAGARICFHPRRAHGHSDASVPPFETQSDEVGRYQLEGLPLGQFRLYVRRAGFAPWTLDAELADREQLVTHVTLERAGIVHGRVTSESGKPIPGARLFSGAYASPDSSQVTSDAKGLFAMRNLPIGQVKIFVEHPTAGNASAELLLQADRPMRWDPQLDRGLVLRGRVQNEFGQGQADWYLDVRCAERGAGDDFDWFQQVTSKEDGRFEVIGCPRVELELQLRRPGYRGQPVETRRVRIQPGEELLFVIPSETIRDAHLSGRVLDQDGDVLAGVVHLRGMAKDGYVSIEDRQDDEGFELDSLPEGRFALSLEPDRGPNRFLQEVTIEASSRRVLPDIILPELGSLSLNAAVPGAFELLILRRIDAKSKQPSLARRIENPIDQVLDLWPGTYELRWSGPATAPFREVLEITPASELRHQVAARPGRPCRIRCDVEGGLEDVQRLSIAVELDGHRIADWLLQDPAKVNGSLVTLLETGRYRLLVQASNGARGRVESLQVSPGPQELLIDVSVRQP